MSDRVHMEFGIRIGLRDSTQLSATLYLPRDVSGPAPCLFALTPYTVDRNHPRACYFAIQGFPFLVVDARGRGNSEGSFRAYIQEGDDGCDIVEWIAGQPFCNGKVAMFSGSYEGYDQWTTAARFPPHLVTIVPGMAPALGIDFPMRNNICYPYVMRWLALTAGRTSQASIFADQEFWRGQYRRWYVSGRPFSELDVLIGNPSSLFQEWISHPELDAYWDAYAPTQEAYAKLDLPILTLTGSYDFDQPGALHHYREHLRHCTAEAANRHYLVIGPWDHTGTLAPRADVGGVQLGPAALLDILGLHAQWYAWTMKNGPKPPFLKKKVAYYVIGAEIWRYADSLEEVTASFMPLLLHSTSNPVGVFQSGSLVAEHASGNASDRFTYDPRDIGLAELECTVDPDTLVDQRMVVASTGRHLVYHSAPFEREIEISGFFRLSAWIAIDQPDTDFRAAVYEVAVDGSSILLSDDVLRARYRESLRQAKLVRTTEPLRYEFERFRFVSRRLAPRSRLRLVLGPINSIYCQKNFNTGGAVAHESMTDARPVIVTLFHDSTYPSALHVPVGATGD